VGLLEHLEPSEHFNVLLNLPDFLLVLFSWRKQVESII
jgi:hypothetical protein